MRTSRESGDRPVRQRQSRRATGGAVPPPFRIPPPRPVNSNAPLGRSTDVRTDPFRRCRRQRAPRTRRRHGDAQEQPASEVLATVELITGDELIMRPAAELSDVLRFVPGVEPARLGGAGQQTSIFVRGTESNHVLVLMDGLRINPGTIGTAAMQNIAPELVERIEIVKGPARRCTARTRSAASSTSSRAAPRTAAACRQATAASTRKTPASTPGSATRNRQPRLPAPGSTARGSRPALATTRIAVPTTTSFTALRTRARRRRSRACGAGTPRARTEYSDFTLAPVDQDFENMALRSNGGFRADRGLVVPSHAGTRRTTSSRTSRMTSSTRGATRSTGRTTSSSRSGVTLTGGSLWQDEEADEVSRFRIWLRRCLRLRHHDEPVLRPGPGHSGPHRMLLGGAYTDHETFGGHATGNVEYGFALRRRRSSSRLRRHRLPGAGCDGSLRHFRR